jgi:translation initiation factor IF-2
MSDNEKSGEPRSAADFPAPAPADAPVKAENPPAENSGTASAPAAGGTAGFGSFGANRGSGLARGKRPTTAAASAAAATSAPSGYKPTSIEVVNPQTEYKNPFTGETSVNAPRANEPVPQAAPVAPMPAQASAPAPAPIPAPAPAIIPERAPSTPTTAPVPESSASLDAAQAEDKAELKILPPEQPKRAAVRWDSSESGNTAGDAPAQGSRRDERPTFRPDRERREGRDGRGERREGGERQDHGDRREGGAARGERRDFRDNRGGEGRGEPRREGGERGERRFEPRQPAQAQAPRTVPEPQQKSGGFIGWLKGLFGGKPEQAPSAGHAPEGRREGGGDRHRHRGGRGRGGQGGYGQGGQGGGYQGENRGPRPEGESGDARGEGDFGGGRTRRRRRGGRGRYQGDRDPRPEGQQGGGAI